jgi:hypothetical protein
METISRERVHGRAAAPIKKSWRGIFARLLPEGISGEAAGIIAVADTICRGNSFGRAEWGFCRREQGHLAN